MCFDIYLDFCFELRSCSGSNSQTHGLCHSTTNNVILSRWLGVQFCCSSLRSLISILDSAATCDAPLLPFSVVDSKFSDDIDSGQVSSHSDDRIFTFPLRYGSSVKINARTSAITVIGLEAGNSYRYAIYQQSNDAHWVGHKSTLSINGGSAITTTVTSGTDPTSIGTFVAQRDGTADFLFTRSAENQHTVFSGLTVSKICAGSTEICFACFLLASLLNLCILGFQSLTVHMLAFTAICDAPLLPFSHMRSKFFDGIEGGKAANKLENKVFEIYLGEGISVVMKHWKVC